VDAYLAHGDGKATRSTCRVPATSAARRGWMGRMAGTWSLQTGAALGGSPGGSIPSGLRTGGRSRSSGRSARGGITSL
jgi:hypothetical protein